jgi:excisionase family DNA binding protein
LLREPTDRKITPSGLSWLRTVPYSPAADILNISRQYLVRLVDTGELAGEKVGSHRRLRAADVAAFKAVRDAKRTSALDRLSSLSEDAGGYELEIKQR